MTTPETHVVMVSGQEKITRQHLERVAYVYIRQSSPGQVANNQESALNQRRMADRAAGLGWRQAAIRILNTDQALSGQSSEPRGGFQELLAEVALGKVGIIFCYEAARLARNCLDWYRLLDLAAVFNTLIGDYDGVYDLNLFNDRLLLGLKGAISEAELHLLQLRMAEGRMRQVERGAYRQHLPTGLVRLEDGTVAKDPDDQIRHAIELVLTQFEALGSARQVVFYLREAGIRLPRRHVAGPHAGQLLWKLPTPGAVYAILTNPAYAGAFAYGRNQTDPTRRATGQSKTGMVSKPRAEWIHLQPDVYPAYISWEQYTANQARLHQNAIVFRENTQGAQGAVRKGAALLQGLVSCGTCGCRMNVRYVQNERYRYVCEKLSQQLSEPLCASIQGLDIDRVVAHAFFDAIQPAQLDVLEAVLADQQADQARLLQHWEDRLKRAQYDARLAQRQYDAVDPDNRLVAAELERRWDAKLVQLRDTQAAYDDFVQTAALPTLGPELQAQFRHMSATLPTLWTSGQLAPEHQKALIRSLISNVVLTRLAPGQVEVRIVWVSGHYSTIAVETTIDHNRNLPNFDQLVARIETLWREGYGDEEMATQLTAEGFRSARSLEVLPLSVRNIRLKQGWKLTASPKRRRRLYDAEGYVTTSGLAQRLGVSKHWVHNRIQDQHIDPQFVTRHPRYQHFLIRDDPDLMAHLHQLLARRRQRT